MMPAILRAARGGVALMCYCTNTLFWCIPLFALVPVKAAVPLDIWRRRCSRLLTAVAENWIWVNNQNQKWLSKTSVEVQGISSLERSGWYLVLANHQSWVDILVLQRIFHRKIPFLKFFIKKELFWLPFLGQAWWALDFPFVERYTRRQLQRKPHRAGRDLEITRRACQKFKKMPASIMNFVEGTRFTPDKHLRQQSPYRHLLKPKAGGIALVLHSLEEQIQQILDVTIVYPDGVSDFWSFLCGNIQRIKVQVRALPVSRDLIGDYANDGDFRKGLQHWLNRIWFEKNQSIERMLAA